MVFYAISTDVSYAISTGICIGIFLFLHNHFIEYSKHDVLKISGKR